MGDRTNVKERCNKSCSTRPQSFPQLDICSAEKGLRSSPSDKFEKSQSLHSLLSFQNGKFIPVEKNIPGRGLHAENRSQGCIFLSPTKPKIPKVCKFQMEGSILFVSLWFGTSPKDIHKVDENSHFSVEKTVCTTDFFFGRYSANGFLKRGADNYNRHCDISYSESRFSDKSQNISTRSMSEYTIFGYGNQLSRNDTDPSTREKKGRLFNSVRKLSQLIGRLALAVIASVPAPLQYRTMQRHQILELQEHGITTQK